MSVLEGSAVTAGMGISLLSLVAFVIWYLPWERGRPYGVTANNEGLWYYPKGWKRRFLRWDEVCLLEVSIPKRERSLRAYKIYGRRTLASWLAVPPSKWVEVGMTKQEFWERHQALLNLIVARTGLVPRTLDEKLAEAASGV